MKQLMKRAILAIAGVLSLSGVTAGSLAPVARAQGMGGPSSDQPSGQPEDTGRAYPGGQGGTSGQTGGAMPGSSGSSGSKGTSSLDSKSKDFVRTAGQDSVDEIQLGRLAEQKAANPAVRDLGRSIVSDHERMTSELKQFASKYDVTVPSSISDSFKSKESQLRSLSGRDFDKQYLSTVISEHEKGIKEFQQMASASDTNPQLQKWAINSLPKLESHLMQARNIQKQVGGASSSGSSSGDMGAPGGQQGGGSTSPGGNY